MKKVYFLMSLTLMAVLSFAQQPNMFKRHTGTLYDAGPFMQNYTNYTNQMIIRASDLTNKQGGSITKIYLRAGNTGTTTYTGFQIRMTQTTQSDFNTYTGGTQNFITPMTLVFSGNVTVSHTADQWVEFTLQNPFGYNGTSNIVVETYYTACTGGISSRGSYYTLIGNMCTEIYNYSAPGASATGNQYPYYKDWGFLVLSGAPAPPIANFFIPPGLCQGGTTTLINNSILSGYNIGYQWTITPSTFSYTAGTNATSSSPKVIFNAAGTYNIKLRVQNNIGADSITKSAVVTTPTVATMPDFVATRRVVPKASQITQFTDLSTNCPTTWAWSSPDYESETIFGNPFINPAAQNGQAFFAGAGTWDICLNASNAIGGQNVCKTNYIKVLESANLCNDTISYESEGFLTDEGSYGNSYGNNRTLTNCKGYVIDPCASSVTVNFEQIKLSAGAGDSIFVHNGANVNAPKIAAFGSNANGSFPSVTANSGKMFIYMITNASGVDSGFVARWTSVAGSYGKPTASFNIPKANGLGVDTFYSGYPINFNNTTNGVDAKFIWDVDGNSAIDSTVANPKNVTLTNFGSTPLTFTPMMIAYNCKGADTVYKNIVIMPVTSAPTNVNFTADKLLVSPSDTVYFTDLTLGASAWEWTFIPSSATYLGGTNRNSQNPIVQFSGAGCLNAKLKVTNIVGSDSTTKICYITMRNYCPPGLANTPNSDLGFSNVTVGSINNTSGIGLTEYTNYADSSFGKTTVYRGGSYSLTVSRSTNDLNMSRKAWVDFNLDGDFDDAGELIGSDLNNKNLSATYNFTIPVTAGIGSARLRVGSTYGNTFLTPCASDRGEFEDYVLEVGRDMVKPVITMLGQDTVYVEVNKSYTDAGATAMDNLEGNITSKIIKSSTVDTSQVGFYTITYNVSDVYGNQADTKTRVVAVRVDMTPPVITVLGSNPVTIHVGGTYTDAGATAVDNYSGVITSLISTINPVNVNVVGTYSVTYAVADYFGFTDMKTRTVFVVDTVSPVINAAATFTHSVKVPLDDQLVAKATDNYYTNVTAVRTGSVDVNTLGNYTVTYNAVDGSGNNAQPVTVVITVADTTKPVISMSGTDTLTLEVYTSYSEPMPTATDNYYPSVTVVQTGSFNRNKVGTYVITYTSTDGSGNIATRYRVINIVDTKAPVISILGDKTTIHGLGRVWVDPGLQIVDNYYTQAQLAPIVVTTSNLDVNTLGTYWMKYNLTDPSGNVADEVTRLIRVVQFVGEEEIVLGSNVNVFPNPSNGFVNVSFNLNQATDVKVTLVDMFGKELQTLKQNVMNDKLSLNLSQYAAGVYFVRVIADNNILTQKITLVK